MELFLPHDTDSCLTFAGAQSVQFPARFLTRLVRCGVREGARTVGRQYGAHDALDGAATSGG